MGGVAVMSEFHLAFRGRFSGVLRWPQLDDFWERVRADATGGWYVYQVGEAVPSAPATADQLTAFIAEVDTLLRQDHQEDYCGIVYADALDAPSFIKIFDPNNLGVSCGYSDNPPLPGWVLSKLPPEELRPRGGLANNRRRWWQRLIGR